MPRRLGADRSEGGQGHEAQSTEEQNPYHDTFHCPPPGGPAGSRRG